MALTVLDSDDNPQTAYYQFETLRTPSDGASPLTRWMTKAFSYADVSSASEVNINIPPMTFVLGVVLQISTAWTAGVTVVIGDDSDPDGWLETGVVDPTSAGDMGRDYDATYSAKGRLYEDGDTLDILFETAFPAAGTAKVFIEVISYNEALADT